MEAEKLISSLGGPCTPHRPAPPTPRVAGPTPTPREVNKSHTYLRMSFLLKKVQSCGRKTRIQSAVWALGSFLPRSEPHRHSHQPCCPGPLRGAVSWGHQPPPETSDLSQGASVQHAGLGGTHGGGHLGGGADGEFQGGCH